MQKNFVLEPRGESSKLSMSAWPCWQQLKFKSPYRRLSRPIHPTQILLLHWLLDGISPRVEAG